jgi:hypothetical protein
MPTFTRFRTNLDNFDRKNIVVNHVGIAETGNVVGERIGGRSGLIVNISPPANMDQHPVLLLPDSKADPNQLTK